LRAEGPVHGRWLTDGNVVALADTLHGGEIAAADAELQRWRSDSVRVFALMVRQEHAGMRQSIDSLAGRLHVAPSTPALAMTADSARPMQLARLRGTTGEAADRAYLDGVIRTHTVLMETLNGLSAIATQPALATLLAAQANRVAIHLARAQALQRTLAATDTAKR
jgi:predicted outer membrane protein